MRNYVIVVLLVAVIVVAIGFIFYQVVKTKPKSEQIPSGFKPQPPQFKYAPAQ